MGSDSEITRAECFPDIDLFMADCHDISTVHHLLIFFFSFHSQKLFKYYYIMAECQSPSRARWHRPVNRCFFFSLLGFQYFAAIENSLKSISPKLKQEAHLLKSSDVRRSVSQDECRFPQDLFPLAFKQTPPTARCTSVVWILVLNGTSVPSSHNI